MARPTGFNRVNRAIVLADCCESVTDEMHQFAITQILPALAEVVTAADFTESIAALRTHVQSGR